MVTLILICLIPVAYSIGRQKVYITTPGDGEVENTDRTWATTRNARRGDGFDYTDSYAEAETYVTFNPFTFPPVYTYRITRGYLPFDMTNHPQGAKVGDGTRIYLYVSSKTIWDYDQYAYVAFVGNTSQDSVFNLSTADFNDCGGTDPKIYSAEIDITDINATAWNTFTLTTVGKASLEASMSSYFMSGFREGHDITNNAITEAPNPSATNEVRFRTNESTVYYRPYIKTTDFSYPQIV